jgi:protein tyrosine/serine phosphatase
MMRRRFMAGAANPRGPRGSVREPDWAEPLPEAGIHNLHRITPTLYRSAQPGVEGVAALRALGVKTVVSLRAFNADDLVFRNAGLRLVRVPINTWHIRDRHVLRALAEIRAAERDGPVLLHCLHGADRTGVVSALYRMAVQGWDKDRARREMFHGGFGYHTLWRNIPAYLERVDPDAMARALSQAALGVA